MDKVCVNPIIYDSSPERSITRAEIDRLTSIIEQLNDALDAAANREDVLRHECDLQTARAEVAEALVGRRRWNDASPAWEHALGMESSDEPLVVNVAINERLKDD